MRTLVPNAGRTFRGEKSIEPSRRPVESHFPDGNPENGPIGIGQVSSGEEGTTKIQPLNPAAPKTVTLDLSDETTVSALSDKWKANPEEGKKKAGEGFSVDLTLE